MLDLPDGALRPKGFSTVDLVLHYPTRDVTRSANVSDLGELVAEPVSLDTVDPDTSVWVEATLRNASRAVVGYGRSSASSEFGSGAEIVVPVLRPIAYIAGAVSRDADGNAATPALRWTEAPATFSDLSVGINLDGRTQVGGQVVLVIAAGPKLYMIAQAIDPISGALMGAGKVVPISTDDHQAGSTLSGSTAGAVTDGAGADDGTTLAIGTTGQLVAVDTASGNSRTLADGNFARVAIVTTDAGEIAAVAIRNRGTTTGTCSSSAELWWATLSGSNPAAAHRVSTGGFYDIATDRGHAYYLDACKSELGEVTATELRTLRSLAGLGSGRPTALAVSNLQAYVGIETPPATTSLLVTSIAPTTEAPRTLWTESAQQVLKVRSLPDVQRQLDASSAVFGHLEVGAGGDYVALTTSAHFHGPRVPQAHFPEMTIDTEELRVFDAATGGTVQRYRSWCDGVLALGLDDISGWTCASTAGQTEAVADQYEHHISSMTFLFGKK